MRIESLLNNTSEWALASSRFAPLHKIRYGIPTTPHQTRAKSENGHHCPILIRATLCTFYKTELALQADLYQAAKQAEEAIRIS